MAEADLPADLQKFHVEHEKRIRRNHVLHAFLAIAEVRRRPKSATATDLHPLDTVLETCDDNAVAESFFATLEKELIEEADWHTRAEAKRAIFDFIEI